MKSVKFFFYAILVAPYCFHLQINAMDKYLYNISTEKKEIDRNAKVGILDSPTPMIRWIKKDKLYKLKKHIQNLSTSNKKFDFDQKYLVLIEFSDYRYYHKGSLLHFACLWGRPTIVRSTECIGRWLWPTCVRCRP